MANVTCAPYFAPRNTAASGVINRNCRRAFVSRGKNRCFTRLVIVQNQLVIYQSRSNRWRARISQTRKRGGNARGTLGSTGRRREKEREGKVGLSGFASTIFFCYPKTADFRSTVQSGAIFTCRPSKQITAVLFACDAARSSSFV